MKKIFLNTAFITVACCCFAQQPALYRIIKRMPLSGNKGWDYLTADASANRLYVSHGDKVQVINTDSDKVIGTISGLKGVHGIAIADDLNKGFISSGKDSMVAVFNLSTLREITKVKVTGANPDCIVYDKFTHRVFTFNGGSNTSTVIDAKTDAVIGTIPLPGRPEFCVADGKGMLYDNIEDKSKVCVLSSVTMKVLHIWPLASGKSPSGMAIDVRNHRLFSACHNKTLVIINADSGNVITTFPIGSYVDGAAFDTLLKRIYISNGDGTLTVVQQENPDKYRLLENLTTQVGARTCTVNLQTHCIYLSVAELNIYPETQGEERPKIRLSPNTFEVLEVVPIH